MSSPLANGIHRIFYQVSWCIIQFMDHLTLVKNSVRPEIGDRIQKSQASVNEVAGTYQFILIGVVVFKNTAIDSVICRVTISEVFICGAVQVVVESVILILDFFLNPLMLN